MSMDKVNDNEGDVLRFTAKLETKDPISKNRQFIISYFPYDEKFIVYEPQMKNSGFTGGKFLDRSRIKKPGLSRFDNKPSDFYTANDLYVGAIIDVNCHKFSLKEADECTLCYMECNPAVFPYADYKLVFDKLKTVANDKGQEIKRYIYKNDTDKTGLISVENFRKCIFMLVEDQLTEHEMLTLDRKYQHKEEETSLSKNTLLSMLQKELHKKNFDGFKDLGYAFYHHDKDMSGYLDINKIERTCKSVHLPVNWEILKLLLSKLELNEKREANYNDFISLLNWEDNPAYPDITALDEPFINKVNEAPQKTKLIEYRPFLKDLLGSSE